jgi:hypothetical protein
MVCSLKPSLAALAPKDVRVLDDGELRLLIDGTEVFAAPRRRVAVKRALVLFEYVDGVTVHEVVRRPLLGERVRLLFESREMLGSFRSPIVWRLARAGAFGCGAYRVTIRARVEEDAFVAALLGIGARLIVEIQKCGSREVEIWSVPLGGVSSAKRLAKMKKGGDRSGHFHRG